MSSVRCFLVVATGQEIVEHRKCSCGNENCEAEYDISKKEYRREDTGQTLFGYPYEFGPGAMHLETYTPDHWGAELAQHLLVVCPDGHEWDIDSRASNCDRKEDNTHRCWIRHGNVPDITVDKNGNTCGAGGGSIRTYQNQYHGRLRNGVLYAESDSQC